jgi:hypothetical protein
MMRLQAMSPQSTKKPLPASRSVTAQETFRFNYQDLEPVDIPQVTCVVPSNWLNKNLPIMGGAVKYIVDWDWERYLSKYVFEFSVSSLSGHPCSINLEIYTQNQIEHSLKNSFDEQFEAYTTIHCQLVANANDDWNSVVILLNHIFCLYAISASKAALHLDMTDFISMLEKNVELRFNFGVGDSPAQILSGMVDEATFQEARYVLVAMFSNGSYRLAFLDEIVAALPFKQATVMIVDGFVDQEKVMISLLIGL